MTGDTHEGQYTKDGRRTAYLPLTFAWLYASFLVPRARDLGYSLCIHGSMSRDLDLVAVPWTDDAVGADELARSLAEEAGGAITDPAVDRPHGRRAWVIHLGSGPYIDLSVMPTRVVELSE